MAIYGGNGGISPVAAAGAPQVGCCDCAGLFWNVADAPDSLTFFADEPVHFTTCALKATAWATGCCPPSGFTQRFHSPTCGITEYFEMSMNNAPCCSDIKRWRFNIVGDDGKTPECGVIFEFVHDASGFGAAGGVRLETCYFQSQPFVMVRCGFYACCVAFCPHVIWRTLQGAVPLACDNCGVGHTGGDWQIEPGDGGAALACAAGQIGGTGGGVLLDGGNGASGSTNIACPGAGGGSRQLRMRSGIGVAGGIDNTCAGVGAAGGSSGNVSLITGASGAGGGAAGAGTGGTGGGSGCILLSTGTGGAGGCTCCNDTSTGGTSGNINMIIGTPGAAGGGGGCIGAWGSVLARVGTTACFDAIEVTRCACDVQMGFYGVTPVNRPAAYTQTYCCADKTNANPLGVAIGDLCATNVCAWGAGTEAEFDSIATTVDNLVLDVVDIKQLLNSIIDDLQVLGLGQ